MNNFFSSIQIGLLLAEGFGSVKNEYLPITALQSVNIRLKENQKIVLLDFVAKTAGSFKTTIKHSGNTSLVFSQLNTLSNGTNSTSNLCKTLEKEIEITSNVDCYIQYVELSK